MNVDSIAAIQDEFITRVHTMVWCNVATVDTQGRPRSRVLHPIWEGSTAYVLTAKTPIKLKHLGKSPYVSLAYIADPLNPIYADCRAEWVDDIDEKRRIWEWFQQEPPPLGYDPTPFFQSVENPVLGLLKLTPWRIELFALLSNERKVWRNDQD